MKKYSKAYLREERRWKERRLRMNVKMRNELSAVCQNELPITSSQSLILPFHTVDHAIQRGFDDEAKEIISLFWRRQKKVRWNSSPTLLPFPFSVISNSPKCFWKVALKLRATDEVEREFSRSHSFNFGFSNGGNWTLKRGKYQRGYLPSEILLAHLFPICSAVTFPPPSFQRHPISALSLQFSPTWNVLRPFFPRVLKQSFVT